MFFFLGEPELEAVGNILYVFLLSLQIAMEPIRSRESNGFGFVFSNDTNRTVESPDKSCQSFVTHHERSPFVQLTRQKETRELPGQFPIKLGTLHAQGTIRAAVDTGAAWILPDWRAATRSCRHS